MANDGEVHRHFILEGVTTTELFSRGGRGRTPRVPPRDRRSHAAALRRQLDELRAIAADAQMEQTDTEPIDGIGIQVEFRSFPSVDLLAERLARESRGIELLNVRKNPETDRTHATVFVPNGQLDHFEGVIRDYVEERVDRRERPRDNRLLVDAIENLRHATLRALWTDTEDEFPAVEDEEFWWEVWLPVRGDGRDESARFRERIGLLASDLTAPPDVGGRRAQPDLFEPDAPTTSPGPHVADGELQFPERTVVLVHATVQQLRRSMLVLNSIAELRRVRTPRSSLTRCQSTNSRSG